MENNDTKFDYSKVFNTIKTGSPVHVINLDINNPNAVVGMYLITLNNTRDFMKSYIKKPNANDNSILVFESRHVSECIQILYGVFCPLISMQIYEEPFIRELLVNTMQYLLKYPHTYAEFKNKLKEITEKIHKETSDNEDYERVINNLYYIINNIWYISYYDIDQILEKATEEYKKSSEENKPNE